MAVIEIPVSVPTTVALFEPTQPITTEAHLVAVWKNLATTLAAAETVLITPEDQTEEGVTFQRSIMDRENKNGASDGVATISRIGAMAQANLSLSRDIAALDDLFYRPSTKAATAQDPGYDSYDDLPGLTYGNCDEVPLLVAVLMPHLCGVATTDIEKMIMMPFAVPRATQSESRFAINQQYSVTGISITGLSGLKGQLKGKARYVKGRKIAP